MTDITPNAVNYDVAAEVEDVELYHPKSFVTKYIWSQDAKVIAIQYAVTAIAIGLVALVLSWMMRLQLGFPDTFSFISPEAYLQLITMHGMIMVIYLLTAEPSIRRRLARAFAMIGELLVSPARLGSLLLPTDDPARFTAKCHGWIIVGHIAGLLGRAGR